ncbi:MAG: glycosyltransferase family 4 protein [Candidatus Rokubacteria bacterium]|nr:glycosyltransferase family 4 protein [Candidatus Rokubacteria bacterium]
MNVLFLNDTLFQDLPSGSGLVMQEVARGLRRRGHCLTIMVPKRAAGLADEEEGPEGRTIRFRYARRRWWHPASFALRSILAFRRLVRRERFDIVHTHFAYAALGPLLLSRRAGSGIVRSFYGPWADEGRANETLDGASRQAAWHSRLRYRVRREIERLSLERSDAIIALSHYSKLQLLGDYGLKPDRIRVVPAGVDAQRFVPPRDKGAVRIRLGLPVDAVVLLAVRRLVPRMGLHNLLQAMPVILAAEPRCLLVICGTGPLRGSLERHIADAGLEAHVRLAGRVPDDILPFYYQAADICILPTVGLEGFGLVTLEALASGIPVLGTAVGATPEILGRLDGDLLIRGTGSEALAGAVVKLLRCRGRYSPEVLRRFAVEQYPWERTVAATEEIYREVVAGQGG